MDIRLINSMDEPEGEYLTYVIEHDGHAVGYLTNTVNRWRKQVDNWRLFNCFGVQLKSPWDIFEGKTFKEAVQYVSTLTVNDWLGTDKKVIIQVMTKFGMQLYAGRDPDSGYMYITSSPSVWNLSDIKKHDMQKELTGCYGKIDGDSVVSVMINEIYGQLVEFVKFD